jgi:hypothetical protein
MTKICFPTFDVSNSMRLVFVVKAFMYDPALGPLLLLLSNDSKSSRFTEHDIVKKYWRTVFGWFASPARTWLQVIQMSGRRHMCSFSSIPRII